MGLVLDVQHQGMQVSFTIFPVTVFFNYREKAVSNTSVPWDRQSCTPLTWINVDFIM